MLLGERRYNVHLLVLLSVRHGKNYIAYGYVGKFTPSIDDTTFTDTNPFFWEAYDVYDLDENGDFNVSDIIILVGITLGTLETNVNGDVNGDDDINVLDIVLLVEIILN